MSEGKRPGGLTAMAVFNFIFGGFGVLGTLAFVAFFAILSASEVDDDSQREIKDALEEMGGSSILLFIVALSALSTLLIIVAGVGYLKQKKFLGRGVGNAWALLSVVSSVVTIMMMPAKAGGDFNIGTIINLIYPVLTLVMLNTTFKEDFIN